MRLVGKVCLELDRTGGLQDLVADQTERALIELDLVVLAVGNDRERPLDLLLLLLDLRQNRLREREYQRYRLDLRDHDEPVGIGRMDDIADIELPHAGDARYWRRQSGIAQLDLGLRDE